MFVFHWLRMGMVFFVIVIDLLKVQQDGEKISYLDIGYRMKVNLFIVGAPKCGTTTVFEWLNQHPSALMSSLKEPHYFNTDSLHRGVETLTDYHSLFLDPEIRGFSIFGEASVWYYISNTAISNILEYNPNAKFIFCIRNPVEAVVSLYWQLMYVSEEKASTFLEAWRLQQSRSSDVSRLPVNCRDSEHLQYGSNYLFCRHITALNREIPPSNLHITFLDDLIQDPELAFAGVCKFLDIELNTDTDLSAKNPRKVRKSQILNSALVVARNTRQKIGIKHGFGVATMVGKFNSRRAKADPISADLTEELKRFFREDVEHLSKLLNRDLSFWVS